jgi:PAS domain S-box-containing protein
MCEKAVFTASGKFHDKSNLKCYGCCALLLPLPSVLHMHFDVLGTAILALLALSVALLVAGRDFVRGRKLAEQLRAEKEARNESARLAAIVESSDDPIISKTLEGEVVSWNAAAQRVFGYSASEVVGKRADLFLTAEGWEQEKQILLKVARGEFVEPFEAWQRDKSGNWHNIAVTISPLRDATGKVIGISKIARDITERKRAEEQFREFAGLLDRAPALVRDTKSRIVLWTRGAEEIFGYTKREALGRVSHELLQTEFPEPYEDIEKCLHAQGGWGGELTHRRKDGERVVAASQWMLQRDASGEAIQTLEVSADITALKRAEMLHLQSQKLEALGTLAGGIAHDFNNILGAIMGSATLAIAQLPANHPAQAQLADIERAGDRAADLVRRILSFSRPQQEQEVQYLQPVVEEALQLVRSALPAMIEIRSVYEANLPAVRADGTQMHQIVLNLVTNAAHAIGEEPGWIEVRLDTPPLHPGAGQTESGQWVRLSVRDSGSGMDAATMERIFDPFFTTKPLGKGTGLGLSMVHGIVKAHGGLLKADSEPGKGSLFEIYLPAAQHGASRESLPENAIAPQGCGERILLVDDEHVLVYVLTATLEHNNYRVTGLTSGEEALRKFAQDPLAYDAVVTDLSMPEISGIQLARAIREIRPEIPILLTSGYLAPEEASRVEKSGILATLIKPVRAGELLLALRDVLEGREVAKKMTAA